MIVKNLGEQLTNKTRKRLVKRGTFTLINAAALAANYYQDGIHDIRGAESSC